MRISDVRFLFGYDQWATRRVLDAAAGVDEADLVRASRSSTSVASAGSSSTSSAPHQRWRHGLSGHAGLAAARARAAPAGRRRPRHVGRGVVEAMEVWLDTPRGRRPRPDRGRRPVLAVLAHLVNHGTQHRSEAAALLTGAGHSPGDLDLIVYCEDRRRPERRGLTWPRVMELVAGEARESWCRDRSTTGDAFDDRGRFDAHLALGGGIDPTWLDLFAEAARTVDRTRTARRLPRRPPRARRPADAGERRIVIERVDPAWVDAVARLPDATLDASPAAGSTGSRRSSGDLPREEKPWIRDLAGQVVGFCRAADRAPDVLFALGARGDRPGDARGVVRGQPGAVGRLDRGPRRRRFYDLDGFRAGGVRLRDVRDRRRRRRGRAARCSTSNATSASTPCPGRASARRSPAPTSRRPRSALARELAADLGFPDARFVESNLYDLPDRARRRRSTSSTRRAASSAGCPTSARWARVVAHFVAPGGQFFITRGPSGRQRLRGRGRRARRAPPRATRTGSTPSRSSSTSRARTPTRPPTSASRRSTAGTTASARSSPPSSTPGCASSRSRSFRTSSGRPISSSRRGPGAGDSSCRRAGRGAAAHVLAARHETGRRLSPAYTPSKPIPRTGPDSGRPATMARTNHDEARPSERERRAAETLRVKEIEAAWMGSL